MLRKETLKRFTTEKIIPIIEKGINDGSFKYLKSKGYFIKKDKGFKEIIKVHIPYSPITYIENIDTLFLEFSISFQLENQEYDKWYFKTFESKDNFRHSYGDINCKIELHFEDFSKDDFYEPTKSQKFKHLVSTSLSSLDFNEKKYEEIDELPKIIKKHIDKFSYYKNIENLLTEIEHPSDYIYYIFFMGKRNMSKELIQKDYDGLIEHIPQISNKHEKLDYISYLEELIFNANKINIELINPFKGSITITENQNSEYIFSEKSKFKEHLRFDISSIKFNKLIINPSNNDFLILADDNKVFSFNNKGEILFETDIKFPNGYYHKFDTYYNQCLKSVYLQEINSFLINHFIIKSDNNKITELELPIQDKKIKKGDIQSPNFNDIVYDSETKGFIAIHSDKLLFYNSVGEITKEIIVGYSMQSKIILEKKIVILCTGNKENTIIDFEGKTLKKLPVGNGNNKFKVSNDNKKILCFGYSTKSQFYDLDNYQKKIVWAHPTFIKGYKEIMYNDTEHNFDLSIAKFSESNNYIIGGGWHGKYVAWKLPKLDRIELIPCKDVISELNYDNVKIVEIDNKNFLKNRSNEISEIYYIENDNYFITEHRGNLLLVWDNSFMNTKYFKTKGRIGMPSRKHLIEYTDNELILYIK